MSTSLHTPVGIDISVNAHGRPRTRVVSNAPDRIPRGLRCRTYLWQLWPGRNWPTSRYEEDAFVQDLKDRTSVTSSSFERGDVTALLNALRCGLMLSELLARAPGLQPSRLLAAYEYLDGQLADSLDAWQSLHQHIDADAITARLPKVRKLLKGLSFVEPANGWHDVTALAQQRDTYQTRLDRTAGIVDAVEQRLSTIEPPDPVGIELGRLLYDPYEPGLWCQQDFLPNRVGSLSPTRIADLLGDRDL